MNEQELAQWIRAEHERTEELLRSLTRKLGTKPPGNRGAWIAEVRNDYDHLRAHMYRHFALEEEGGYLTTVMELRPTLAPQVERLKQEHGQFVRIMDSIHRALYEARVEDDLVMDDWFVRIQNLIRCLGEHEQKENHMVTFAVTQDLGSTD